MLRKIAAVFVATLLFVFFSGCTHGPQVQEQKQLTTESMENIEEKAVAEVEKEMDEILQNMTMDDIENAIIE